MKKFLFLVLLVILILLSQINLTGDSNRIFGQTNGKWILIEKTKSEEPMKKPPFSTEITGGEGSKILTAKFENQNVKEIAIIEIGWTVPPKQLIPGEDFEFIQTGLIKEWKTTHFFSSSMYSRIQRYGASCCEIAGPDLGYLRMDYDNGDAIGVKKEVKKVVKVPSFGDLGSEDTKKIQILVKLMQNSSEFQWIYIYEWKEVPVSKSIKIELKIGNKTAIVNGIIKSLDVPPFIENGRTFVPFRFLGESFGATVSFTTNPSTKLVETVQYKLDELSILLFINQKEAMVGNKKIQLDAPPMLKNGRVMVPLRFVSENLSTRVDWNTTLQSITISRE